MNIEQGWRFYTADFSMQAMTGEGKGTVTFIRDATGRKMWHELPEDEKENEFGIPLYVYGSGATIEDAIISANLMAAHAKPIEQLA